MLAYDRTKGMKDVLIENGKIVGNESLISSGTITEESYTKNYHFVVEHMNRGKTSMGYNINSYIVLDSDFSESESMKGKSLNLIEEN